ncbi:MAG: FAD-dependent oxidoreductase [Parabacteroides sp.]|nr:FAD-dependent oxidoreductase [Parabacteroides sp.]
MNKYDAVIIGFGKGGKTLAAALAGKGWTVALVERSAQMYGGACINVACIPTKAMVHLAGIARCRKFPSFEQQASFYREAIATTNKLVTKLREKNYELLHNNDRITVITGEAAFVSPHEIEITTATSRFTVRGEKIFINTGSEPVIPSVTGVTASRRVYTSETMLRLEALPRRLVIVGGGYVGLEFASMYAGFGSQVTVLDHHPRLLPKEDDDIASSVKKTLEKKGIVFHEDVLVQSVHDEANETTISYIHLSTEAMHRIPADAVLLATGRKPTVERLNLEAAGVQTDEHGAIDADLHLHTSAPHIRVMGDAKGAPLFTYVSLDDYRIVADELFGDGHRTTADREPIPSVVYIDPPLATIGLREEEAFLCGCNIRVARLAASEIGRALTLEEPEGLLKIVVDADTNRIIGCAFFCAGADEIINLAAVAIHAKLDYRLLRDQVFTHPSMSEAFNKLLSLIDR